MAKTVFVLGAGASAKAGAPLMSTFLDKARDLLASGKVDDKKEDFERVFKALVKLRDVFYKSGLDLDNIESVFGAFEMARIIGKLGDCSQAEIDDFSDSIRVLIVRTLDQSIRYDYSLNDVTPPVPYGKFVRLLKGMNKAGQSCAPNRCSVLTFNYDIALDYAFTWSDVPIDYCLQTTTEMNAVKLLKLHGSLNWGRCPSCREVTAVPFSKGSVMEYARKLGGSGFITLPAAQELINATCDADGCGTHLSGEPIIVPPTWNKTEGHANLANVWKQAAIELGEAENIICIGYSLPESDLFFRYLFALGTVGEAHLRRFWVFDPDTEGVVQKRYDRLIGKGIERRFKFMSGGNGIFGAAINLLREDFVKSQS